LLVVGHVGAVLRFRGCLDPLRAKAPVNQVVTTTFLAILFNQLLPTGVGGDVARLFAIGPKANFARVLYASLADRAIGFVMIIVSAAMLAPLYDGYVEPQIIWMIFLFGVAVVAAVAFLAIVRRTWFEIARQRRFLMPEALWNILRAIRIILRPQRLGFIFFAMLLAYTPYILGFYVIGTAIGSMPIASLACIPLILLTTLIPLSVGGWGVREGAALVIFGRIGVSPEIAIGASMMFGILMTFSSLSLFLCGQVRGYKKCD